MSFTLQESIDRGLLEPVILPNGEPFIIDGIQHYQPTQGGVNMLQGRLHAVMDIIRQHEECRLSATLLEANRRIKKDLLAKALGANYAQDSAEVGRILSDLNALNENEIARLKMGDLHFQLLEIASIWYVDQNEHPSQIDPELNRQKIIRWSQHPELIDFFFSIPVAQSPFLSVLFEQGIQNYIALHLMDDLSLQMNILSNYATTGLKDDTMKLLGLLTASSRNLIAYSTLPSMITTSS